MIPRPIGNLLPALFLPIMAASVIVAAAAVVFRFRRARADEREQIKWLAYAAVLGTGLTIVLLAAAAVNWDMGSGLSSLLFSLVIAGIPLATGIAILKYRLYAIDLLIRRTLIYGLLTGLLALAYLAAVVVLEAIVAAVSGQQHSELVTVLATLLIAALFVPLRRVVQAAIDRRFYRRKYDAARILAEFGASLRGDASANLDDLSSRLLAVVDETMRPTAVSLWLKK